MRSTILMPDPKISTITSVLVILLLLSSCTKVAIGSSNFSPKTENCDIGANERLVLANANTFRPGTDRIIILSKLSELATVIWARDLPTKGICRTKHDLSFKPSAPVYDISFKSEIEISFSANHVCLSYKDMISSDGNRLENCLDKNGKVVEYTND